LDGLSVSNEMIKDALCDEEGKIQPSTVRQKIEILKSTIEATLNKKSEDDQILELYDALVEKNVHLCLLENTTLDLPKSLL